MLSIFNFSNVISKVGRKNKSINNAIAMVIAVSKAMSEFTLKPDNDKWQTQLMQL